MDKREERRKEEEEEEEDHRHDTCLGFYGTMSIGMEFEYSFVWKLWEYGSLVLV